MQDETFPERVPGPALADLRKQVGVKQIDLARRLGVHRVALSGWERAASVDPIKAARYQRALRELVDEAMRGVA